MSRGACTDVTWANPSCARLCTNVVPSNWVNVFACDAVNFVCGTGAGRGNCTASNFTIPPQRILLRDDQQPNSKNGVAYTNRSINLVQASSASSTAPLLAATSAAPTPSSTHTTSHGISMMTPSSTHTASHGTSTMTVGLGVSIPLGILLLASLAVILLQWRNLRRLKRNQGGAPNAGLEDSDKKTMPVSRPYGTGIGELPTSFAGHETEGIKPVHEMQCPMSDPSTAITSTAPRSMVWNEASGVYAAAY